MKYLSSQPFSSPAASRLYLDNYASTFGEKPKPTEVSWLACANCGSPVRPYEIACPACGVNPERCKVADVQPGELKI